MRRFQVDIEGGQLAGIAFGDPVRPTDALFLHANGFNAMTYQSILGPLGLRAHVAGLDMRGHGRSTVSADPSKLKSWHVHRDDVIAALEQIAPQGTVLAGHSMGATTALLVAGKRPDLVTGLVLVDPVILPPPVYFWFHVPLMGGIMGATLPLAKAASKRRSEFETPEEAYDYFYGRGGYKSWREPFLQDFVTDGLSRDLQTNTYSLACAPSWEAACFKAQRNQPWNAVKKVQCPMVIIRAEKESTLVKSSVSKFMKIKPLTVLIEPTGTSHFAPMERPYVVRDAIAEFLAQYVEDFELEEGRVQRNLDSAIGQKD